MPSDAEIRARWAGRLKTRETLLARARQRHEWLHNAATRAVLTKRKAQVAFAQRVVARHAPKTAPTHGVSNAGVAFIAAYEGFVAHPYRDAVGVWTIGYGHTHGVGPHSPWLTKAQALDLLHADLNKIYAPPVLDLHLPHQLMTDAIVSAVYNLGPGILSRNHTLGLALNARNWDAAAGALLLYDKAGSPPRALPGLTARRRAERAMFLRGLAAIR